MSCNINAQCYRLQFRRQPLSKGAARFSLSLPPSLGQTLRFLLVAAEAVRGLTSFALFPRSTRILSKANPTKSCVQRTGIFDFPIGIGMNDTTRPEAFLESGFLGNQDFLALFKKYLKFCE